ncbi:MAG: AMP-binding protein, partial [Candidatus Tectomicrobia bacterium]
MNASSQPLCIPALLQARAEQLPDAPVILAPGRAPLSYRHFYRQMHTVVQQLRTLGVGRQDRLALVLPNGPEMAVAALTVAAGATCAPLNPAYRAREFDFYLEVLHPHALIIQQGMDSPVRARARARGMRVIELAAADDGVAGLFTLIGEEQADRAVTGFAGPDDVALVLHTSGTTSRPKVVPLTQANICTAASHLCAALALTARDRCLNMLPLFHTYGLVASTLTSLMTGASTVCLAEFEAAQFFACLEDFQPTWYQAVPAMHQAILAQAARYPDMVARCRLRFIRSGSTPLPPAVRTALERTFNATVIEGYGMVEASGPVTCNPPPFGVYKQGSIGAAIGPEVAIVDEHGALRPAGAIGEIVVRGATVMQGYENDALANRHAFIHEWFRSGDAGYLDGDGYLFLSGRLKEMINRGGEKIAPWEVDEVLMDHPAVAQAMTYAVPHPRLGEDIAAAVVLHQDATMTA